MSNVMDASGLEPVIKESRPIRLSIGRKTISIDFDGVIHQYSKGWKDGSIYDKPVKGALQAIQILYGKGYTIVVFTTRKNVDDIRNWIIYQYNRQFPNDELFEFQVTNEKQPAIAYIDDRAIRFTNWRDILNYF